MQDAFVCDVHAPMRRKILLWHQHNGRSVLVCVCSVVMRSFFFSFFFNQHRFDPFCFFPLCSAQSHKQSVCVRKSDKLELTVLKAK